MELASLVIAAVAAGCNALSSVLQRKANRDESANRRFGPALLLDLVRRPAWLLGMAAMIAAFLLQAAALSLGALAAVEPVLVIELPLTLVLGALILRHNLRARDWGSGVAMAGGLALFIVALAPSGGDAAHVSRTLVVLATVATVLAIALIASCAHLGPARGRAALFGVAAGGGFGLTASLMKIAVTDLVDDGPSGLALSWETYGTIAAGLASVVLVQAALHAGTLVAAQPGLTLVDPLISLLWGTVVIGETTRTGPALILAGLGAAIVAAAVIALSRPRPPGHRFEADGPTEGP